MAFCFILWMSCFYILLDLVERAPIVEEDPLSDPYDPWREERRFA